MRGHVTIIGCPKLDAVDYSEKLTEIIRSNDIKSVTVLRMEVPCCGGAGARCHHCSEEQRQVHPVECSHILHRWPHPRPVK